MTLQNSPGKKKQKRVVRNELKELKGPGTKKRGLVTHDHLDQDLHLELRGKRTPEPRKLRTEGGNQAKA